MRGNRTHREKMRGGKRGRYGMKSYLDLVRISAKIRRKQSRMTRLCIVLAVFLVAAIFSMADMEIQSQIYQVIQSNGSWHAAFQGIDGQQEKLVRARAEAENAASYTMVSDGTEGDYLIEGTSAAVMGMDENLTEMMPAVRFQEGGFPDSADEAAVTESVRGQLGLEIGDTVHLTSSAGEELSLTVAGVLEDDSVMGGENAFGLLINSKAVDKYFSNTVESGDVTLLVQFHRFCNIQKTLDDICGELGIDPALVGTNARLLALQFQSNDSGITGLYSVAAVLAVLVTVAGVLMISSSMNSSVARRTQFFGMMRCLGADQRQVRRLVRSEALNWCRTAIPIGLGMSVLVVWALCAMLRAISPTYFNGLPVFGVSWPGLAAGVLVGLVTVLLAARSPAKRAAKVSPLTAVSGNAGSARQVRGAVHTRLFHIETALGIHHAAGSRKNFLLMAGSFAFSIILFLSFSPAVDFMNHAIKPLRPSAPDLSVVSQDNTCSIPRELAEELRDNPVIKKVYGRSFACAVPARAGGEEIQIDLVSYEENQFRWAEDAAAQGSLADAEAGKGVMAVKMNAAREFSVGEEIEIDFTSGTKTVNVSGVLNESVFHVSDGSTVLICSEELFRELTGQTDYTVIDVQFQRGVTDRDVEKIRALAGDSFTVEDNREDNSEVRGAYYSFALFLYGFLAVITLISVFNIINSISMSVSARIQQYGAMRAIGMSSSQLLRMIAAEAVTYVVWGMIAGCAAGLLLNWKIFGLLVTDRWGDPWYVPVSAIAVILAVMTAAAVAAVKIPARQIREMSVADTISAM